MGAFGIGPFENDGAMDWLDSFKQRKSVKLIERAIADYPVKTDGEQLIAALRQISALLEQGELAKLWVESADCEQWRSGVRELQGRLTRPTLLSPHLYGPEAFSLDLSASVSLRFL